MFTGAMPIPIANSASVFDLRRGIELGAAAFRSLIGARASRLATAGASMGKRVVVCHDDDVGVLIDVLASMSIGATCAPLSPSLTVEEKHYMERRLRPALWVGRFDEAVCRVLPGVDVGAGCDGCSCDAIDLMPADAGRIVLILTTSGTTGSPKCVQISDGALRSRLALNVAEIGVETLAQSLLTLPLHFGHGLIGNALTPLAVGGRLVAGLPHALADRARLGAMMDEFGITFLSSVPSFWRLTLRVSSPPRRASLKRVHVGSERLPADLWKRIADWTGAPVYNVYGMTEAANWISGISGDACGYAESCVGAPWGGEFWIDGADPTSQAGEVLVRSPALMTSYFDDAKSTAETIGTGWLRTGDTGFVDAGGRLHLTGRIKHQINRAGIKISAEEVERLLERHEAVAECCAFPLPDPASGERVAAAVVLRDGAAADTTELAGWCRRRIRIEAVPETIVIVETLARNSRGKLDRNATRDMVLSNPACGTTQRSIAE